MKKREFWLRELQLLNRENFGWESFNFQKEGIVESAPTFKKEDFSSELKISK